MQMPLPAAPAPVDLSRRGRGRPLTLRGAVRKLKHAERYVWETPIRGQEIDVVRLTLRDLQIARSWAQAEFEDKAWAC